MPLATTIKAGIDFNQSGTADFGPQRFQGQVQSILQLTTGTGANQADLLYVDERTVASATNDDIDLAGVLVSAFGTTITAVEVVAILLINAPLDPLATANTTNLTLGGATNPVPNISSGAIGPRGVVLLADPDAGGLATVTASTGDILRVANSSGAAAKYQIALICRSA
jgi:hypothetical protein